MARPTTKAQLIAQSEENFKKLFALINSLTTDEQEKTFFFEDRDRNIRDVLVHLYECVISKFTMYKKWQC